MVDFRIWQIAGWTMLHYLWVGGVLGVIAVVLRRGLRAAGTNLRYLAALGCFALLGIAPLPIAMIVTHRLPPPRIEPLITDEPASDAMPMSQAWPASDRHAETAWTAPAILSAPPGPAADAGPALAPFRPPGEVLRSVLDRAVVALPWLWVFGTPMTFLWTTVGLLGAERLRQQSRLLKDDPLVETCRRLAAALSISRRVSVGICDRIAAPILVGIFRPLILLPAAALAGWDPQQLEMVLLHELAHVRRYDNLVNLISRIVESMLFFHPMVWIVSGWVRREREHCCDESVVTLTRQPPAYAEMLVNLSERVSKNALRNSPLAPGQVVSSMAERQLVARIRRILKKEEQAMQVSRRTVGLMFVGISAVVILFGRYYSTLTFAGTFAGDSSKMPASDKMRSAAAPTAEGQIIFAGLCRDERGRAIADAQLSLFLKDNKAVTDERLRSVRTDEAGRFRFEPVTKIRDGEDCKSYWIAAAAKRRATVVLDRNALRKRDYDALQIVMSEATSVRGKITGPDGRPVAGAKVWTTVTQGPIDGINSATSDADGLYEISDLEKRDGKPVPVPGYPGAFFQMYPGLRVQHPQFARTMEFLVKVPGTVNVSLEHAAVIEGRVVYGESEKPAADVRLGAQAIRENGVGPNSWGDAITDSKGRYRFDSLAGCKYNILLSGQKDDYTMVALEAFEATAGKTKRAPDLRLVHGGLIVRRIVDADTGKPFRPMAPEHSGPSPYIRMYGPSRPWSGGACETATIQEDGSFQLRAAPGNNDLDLQHHVPRPLPGVNQVLFEDYWQTVSPGSLHVDVTEGETVTIEFKLRRTPATEVGRFSQKPETQPATQSSSGTANAPAAPKPSDPSGKTSPANPADTPSLASDQSATKDGAKTEVKAEDASNGRYVSGLVVDDHKRSVQGAEVRLYETRGRNWSRQSERLLGTTTTDAQGRFRLDLPLEKKRCKLTVQKKGFASRVIGPYFPLPHEFTELVLSKPRSLHGRVTGPDGQPVAGADVWTPNLKEPIAGIESAKTDANGYFEIPDLTAWEDDGMPAFTGMPSAKDLAAARTMAKPGTNKRMLRVRHPDYGTKLGPYSRIPETVNVSFNKPAIVTGRVVDQSRGTPLRGFLARLQCTADFVYGDAITDERGGFRVLLQSQGRCRLWFECEPEVAKGEFAARQVEAVLGSQLDMGTIQVDLGKKPSPTTSAPAAEKPNANDPSGKASTAKPAVEVSRASDQSVAKEESKTGSKRLSIHRFVAEPNTDEATAVAEIEKLRGRVWAYEYERRPGKPVISVDLGNTNVTDAGLEQLKRLPQLQSLSLLYTHVSDVGLEHLQGLSKLQSISLGLTKVTDAGLEHLKGMNQLQSLNLINTQVSDAGLEHLKVLTTLQSLNLMYTKVTDTGMASLKGLPQLHSLELGSGISDAGLEHLKCLSKLRSLFLTGEEITDRGLEHLKGLPQLQSLSLVSTKVTDAGLANLRGFPQLQSLDLARSEITDAGLVHLTSLRKLESLDLMYTKVTDAGLADLKDLTQLKSLSLASTKVTDAGLVHLKGLSQLKLLNLTGCKVTDAAVNGLQKAFPNCQIARGEVAAEVRILDFLSLGFDPSSTNVPAASPAPASPKANDQSSKAAASLPYVAERPAQ